MKYGREKKIKRDEGIKQYAKEHPELAQREIAIKFKVHQSHVSRVLNGKIVNL